ncbi:MAG: hypothetical protein ACI8P0_000052 [Planctomycetaceae bacterium]|jgi:hypothetical protein
MVCRRGRLFVLPDRESGSQDLRAGTPRFPFGPLVTPYAKLTCRVVDFVPDYSIREAQNGCVCQRCSMA